MSGDVAAARTFLVYALLIPLALFMGYLLATPTDLMSLGTISLIIVALVIPLMLKWHHQILLLTWNATLIVFFLPGQPPLYAVIAATSLLFSIARRTLTREGRFLSAPSVAAPLIFLTAVVLFTAMYRGGLGSRALGSEMWGAKRYLYVFGAVIGFFALIAQPILRKHAKLFVALFFLSQATAIFSDLAYAIGPSAYFLFAIFPAELAFLQVNSQNSLFRSTGLAWAGQALIFVLLLRNDLRDLLTLRRFWQMLALLGCIGLCLLGGYRSSVILLLLLFLTLLLLEKLHRTIIFFMMILVTILVGVFVVAFVDRLPLPIQRSLSFLPLKVDPVARQDAQSSLDWRIDMWKILLPEVPKYFFIGKGFSFSGTDLRLTEEAMKRGLYFAYEDTIVSGNYHSGPLTVIIPFGIFGAIGFGWFVLAAWRVLYLNHRYGDLELKTINRFLLGYFLTRLVFYVVFYGQFDLDLLVFAGVTGLSISLNHGICRGVAPVKVVQSLSEPKARPILRLPVPAPAHLMPNP